jgi:FlaA1/EpsC-like NDP-sugar epimerase
MSYIPIRIEELSSLATGRQQSLFSQDIEGARGRLRQEIQGRRILAVGAAGSIGAATVRQLIPFRPAALHIVDQNENGLAEVVRDLRSRFDAAHLPELRLLPLRLGSPIMERFLNEEPRYDAVLNFSALKHVRSEKDTYSILQMLETNVLAPLQLLRRQADLGGGRYFCVSTDKAANPVNLMGASKRLMEHVIFSREVVDAGALTISSARFANVAFSDGSLLQGWLMRLAQGQPLAVPRETRRFFVSLEEAGQICLLAAFLAPDRHLLVPRLEPDRDLLELSGLATRVLERFGYQPRIYEDEAAARQAASGADGTYPLLLTPLDTSGEKPYEEFLGEGETSVEIGLRQLLAVAYRPVAHGMLAPLLKRLEGMIQRSSLPASKEGLLEEMKRILPEFQHSAGSKQLDQRL